MNSIWHNLWVMIGAGVVLLAAILIVWARRSRRPGLTNNRLTGLQSHFKDPTVRREPNLFQLTGTYLERRVAVEIVALPLKQSEQLTITIAVPGQFHLLIEPKGPDTSRLIEVFDAQNVFRTGVEVLDRGYTIGSRYREDAVDLLKRPGIKELLESLFRYPYQTIRIDNGRLEARVWNEPQGALSGEAKLRERIDGLYRLCELLVQVGVLHVAKARLREVSCPYCRSGILDGSPLIACANCQTPHHRECWEESHHCSVFGCNGVELRKLLAGR